MAVVEEVAEVDVDMGEAEVVVDSIVSLQKEEIRGDSLKGGAMRAHSATVEFPLVKVPQKKEILGDPLKGGAMLDLAVPTVVVAAEVLVMEMMVMGNVLVGHLSAVVGLDAGEYLFLFLILVYTIFFSSF